MAQRSFRTRRSWHGAHRERAVYAAAGRRGAAAGLTAPYLVMLALIALSVTLLGLYAWSGRAPPGGEIAASGGEIAAPGEDIAAPAIAATSPVRFTVCGSGPRIDCVVDGDTFWIAGEKIRILDIDTPETHPSRCAHEARLGRAATRRLHALLNAGPVSLEREGEDRYGRTLARVTAAGRPVGEALAAERLARPYAGGRRSWC